MPTIKNIEKEYGQEENEKSFIDFQLIYRTVILNWYWFILSVIICVGLAAIYLRYTTPTYQTVAKLLIKTKTITKNRELNIRQILELCLIQKVLITK